MSFQPLGSFSGAPIYHSLSKMAFVCGTASFPCLCRIINSTHFILSNCDPARFYDADLDNLTPITRSRTPSGPIQPHLITSPSPIASPTITTQSSTPHHGSSASSSSVTIAIVISFIALAIAVTASSILIKVSTFSILQQF